jgi:hypothetical protein
MQAAAAHSTALAAALVPIAQCSSDSRLPPLGSTSSCAPLLSGASSAACVAASAVTFGEGALHTAAAASTRHSAQRSSRGMARMAASRRAQWRYEETSGGLGVRE